MIDIIVPTYREAENIKDLVDDISTSLQDKFEYNLYIVDDNSCDGTVELVHALNLNWIHLIVRTEDRGLSQSVIAGLNASTADYKVVMDADLSHPANAILPMIDELDNGADFVLGSRYVNGGSTDDDWGFFDG